jgi:hypothetical protein
VLSQCARDLSGLRLPSEFLDVSFSAYGLTVDRVLEALQHGLQILNPSFQGRKTLLDVHPRRGGTWIAGLGVPSPGQAIQQVPEPGCAAGGAWTLDSPI